MRSALPVFAMIILALVIILGVIIFGGAMQMAYVESNYTAVNTTLISYEVNYAWWGGFALLVLIIAAGFALWHFFG